MPHQPAAQKNTHFQLRYEDLTDATRIFALRALVAIATGMAATAGAFLSGTSLQATLMSVGYCVLCADLGLVLFLKRSMDSRFPDVANALPRQFPVYDAMRRAIQANSFTLALLLFVTAFPIC